MWIVSLAAAALRIMCDVAFVMEFQRVLGGIVKRTGDKCVRDADRKVLAAADIELREEFVKSGSYRLRTLFCGNPEDPPLVLIHGHSMSASFWYRNFRDLQKMGYYVIALDLLGWGLSDRPVFEGRKADECIRFYLESFEEWAANLSLEKFNVIAHSIGAYLAYEFCKRNPWRVSRLMLIAPAAIEKRLALYRGVYFTLTPQMVARRLGLLGFLMFQLKFPNDEAYNANNLKELVWQVNSRPNPSGDIAIRHLIRFESWNRPVCKRALLDGLTQLPMPVHLVSGDQDNLVRHSAVERLYFALKNIGVDATLDVAPSDHCPFLETPDEFRSIVAKYFVPAPELQD